MIKAFFFLLVLLLSVSALAQQETETAPLSFDKAIEKIVRRSTGVGVAQETLKALEAKNLSKHLVHLPSLSLEGTHRVGRQYQETRTLTTRSAQATARVNLYRFGSDEASRLAAKALEAAQKFEVRDAVLTVEDSGVAALAGAVEATMRVEVLKVFVEVRKEALKIAKERYKLGYLAEQAVSMVQIDLDNTVADLRDAEANLISANAALYALLGNERVQRTWPWKDKLDRTSLLDSKPIDLTHRPDWQAARKRVDASDFRLDEDWGKVFPSLDLTAGYGYQHDVTAGGDGTSWSGLITMSIPLFDKLSNYGTYRSRIHEKKASELQLEKTRRDARSGWTTAKGSFKISLTTAKAREKTVRIAEKLLADNIARFRKGRISVNDLQLDQDRMLKAKLLSISGWRQAHVTFSQLCHSLGKRTQECLQQK